MTESSLGLSGPPYGLFCPSYVELPQETKVSRIQSVLSANIIGVSNERQPTWPPAIWQGCGPVAQITPNSQVKLAQIPQMTS
jgi:hypothetical protein